jgi:hypothetical protein
MSGLVWLAASERGEPVKVGTRVIVCGLDAFRGLTGTYQGKDGRGWNRLHLVRLDDGRVIRTSAVSRAKR